VFTVIYLQLKLRDMKIKKDIARINKRYVQAWKRLFRQGLISYEDYKSDIKQCKWISKRNKKIYDND
jgi:hypothetical protein